MEQMTFRNNDMAWDIAALILTPPDFDPKKTYPTIISVHPFGSCKEQTSGEVYGKRLADQGFVVIAYDASYQGESGGQPRWVEDPTQRVEDVSHVIDYAVTLTYVDADRIGGIGICGGGGYILSAALTEKRIKAVACQKVGAFGAYCDGMEAYGRATASRDRQLVSLEDWSHSDLYDKQEPVSLAMDRMVPFLKQHVAGEAAQAKAAG
ncbi:hypothetical protein SAMN05421538_102172 [Paracoccus isoporae]|uniref:Xaa-Pro dipeptidyl-peptidase-like domain-containing protein n=1 Tax=Paracoccus isoporae TaxID=591205 RepID=A0A1G6WNT7_9RHOB|nr:alpha/beta hydrolase [Paracoccus isoporae]SDD66877.1 hypothetical protein SAMN05421538_102172 [Paracoccus isoporae]